MAIENVPLISFHKNVLDPCIMVGTFLLLSKLLGIPFSGFHLILVVLCILISTIIYKKIDPYRAWRNGHIITYVKDIYVGWFLTIAALLCIGLLSGFDIVFSLKLMTEWFIVTPFVLVFIHLIEYKITARALTEKHSRSVIIIGANKIGQKLAETIKNNPHLGMHVTGFFDDREFNRIPKEMHDQILGKNDDVAAYILRENIKVIFISQPISAQPRISKLIDECKDTTASIYFIPDIYIFDLIQARFDNIAGMPIVAVCETPFLGDNSLIKRLSDLILLLLLLPVLLPVFITVSLAVKLTSPGPVIFKQRRYGLDGREIIVYKFRSMKVVEDGSQIIQAKANDNRLTKIGGFLRRSSLDEIPQFINVLQGSMSIVGPRPHAVAHNELYRKIIKGYMLRHKVKPGITGWAQVNGFRGETDTVDKMKARIEYDLNYMRNWSIGLDLWIILATLKVAWKGENAH